MKEKKHLIRVLITRKDGIKQHYWKKKQKKRKPTKRKKKKGISLKPIYKAEKKRKKKKKKKKKEDANLKYAECNRIKIIYNDKIVRKFYQCGEYGDTKKEAIKLLDAYLLLLETRAKSNNVSYKRMYNILDKKQYRKYKEFPHWKTILRK